MGKVSALLLVYLVAGSITGSALAVRSDDIQCWPTEIFYAVTVECTDKVVQQGWWYGVGLPNALLSGPVSILVALTGDYDTGLGILDIPNSLIVAVIAFFGFAAWLRWSPLVAWALVIALAGEIIYLRLLVPDGQRLLESLGISL